jgi:PhzF family phenazine biosynthesis protein
MDATILNSCGFAQAAKQKNDTMDFTVYQVDAFTSEVFGGNPAAIMPLEAWIDDETLQSLAMENNLAETAYYVPCDQGFELRWFTPTVEVNLCGHATLAAAHVLFEHLDYQPEAIRFQTLSGELRVTRSEAGLTLDFPAAELSPVPVEDSVSRALGADASTATVGSNAFAVVYVFDTQADVAGLSPDFPALMAASDLAIIATAPGDNCDFVSRFFGPQVGIDEDPVTGSAHCSLVPYWAERLGKNTLAARQISSRGGQLACKIRDGRVFMTGTAVTYMIGTVFGVT